MNINITVPDAITTPQKTKVRMENHTTTGSGFARTPPSTKLTKKNHDAVGDVNGTRKQPNTSFNKENHNTAAAAGGGGRRSPQNTNLDFRTGFSGHLALQRRCLRGRCNRWRSLHRFSFY